MNTTDVTIAPKVSDEDAQAALEVYCEGWRSRPRELADMKRALESFASRMGSGEKSNG